MTREAPDPEPSPRRPVFFKNFLEDSKYWAQSAPAMARRLDRLVSETLREPFTGIGKPEPLRFSFHGYWSRRITEADRLVYKVTDATVEFYSARNHYPRQP